MNKKKSKNQCSWCCKEVNKRQNKYCDNNCYYLHTKAENKNKFEKGQLKDNKTLKKHLIEDRGDFCEICNQTNTWNGFYLSLQVDHINGDSDNNKPKNLRLLCPNCHTQTETFSNCKGVKKETKRNRYLRKYKGY